MHPIRHIGPDPPARFGWTLGRWPRRLAKALAIVTALFTLGCLLTLRPAKPALYPPAEDAPRIEVRLTVSYKWMHAELSVPRRFLAAGDGPSRQALEYVGEGEWIGLGWGDAAYYRERGVTDARIIDFLRSMLEPNSPAVIEYVPERGAPSPETTGRKVVALFLSQEGAEALRERLDKSFALAAGSVQPVGHGRDPASQFFRSHAKSDLARTCNHWIADLLHTAGVPSIDLINTHSAGLELSLVWLAGAKVVPGNAAQHTSGPETPPTHSGRYTPLSGASALTAGDLVFQDWTVRLGEVDFATRHVRFSRAGKAGLADVLDVTGTSLVTIRDVEAIDGRSSAASVCAGAPPAFLAIGFEARDDGAYEIALAAYAADPASSPAQPCASARYLQP